MTSKGTVAHSTLSVFVSARNCPARDCLNWVLQLMLLNCSSCRHYVTRSHSPMRRLSTLKRSISSIPRTLKLLGIEADAMQLSRDAGQGA
ncbi:MAG: hypothetical protein KME05_02525 [Gloeocapsa sp. UFS-A4-WI-NPMV-4B04]|nr:hypothetical protein [Gloeocapsa sp. UFS-A4-WI-NPMV-4B04]